MKEAKKGTLREGSLGICLAQYEAMKDVYWVVMKEGADHPGLLCQAARTFLCHAEQLA